MKPASSHLPSLFGSLLFLLGAVLGLGAALLLGVVALSRVLVGGSFDARETIVLTVVAFEGVLLLVAASQVPYRLWQSAAWPLVVVSFVLLVLVILPFTHAIAPVTNGARRWLDLGVRFQPSEFAKLAVIVWTASMAVKKQEQDAFQHLGKGLGPFLLVWGLLLVPILVMSLASGFGDAVTRRIASPIVRHRCLSTVTPG